jgi:RecA/RadA recombinase
MAKKKVTKEVTSSDFGFFNNIKTGNEIADSGEKMETISRMDTGCYALNAIYSGSVYEGFASNRIAMLAGEEAVGKTFFTLLGHCRPLAEDGYFIYYIDTEGAVDDEMLQNYGVPEGQFKIVPISTVEEVRVTVSGLLDQVKAYNKKEKTKLKVAFVMDSLGNLATDKSVEDTSKGKSTRDMTKQQGLKRMFSELTSRMTVMNIPWIITNHVYEKVGSYIPGKQVAGGSGALYNSSVILTLRKKKKKEEENHQTEDGAKKVKERKGTIVIANTSKSRYIKEDCEAQFYIDFKTGLNRYWGLHQIAIRAGIMVPWEKSTHGPDSDSPIARPDGLHHAKKVWILKGDSDDTSTWFTVAEEDGKTLHSKNGIGRILDTIDAWTRANWKYTSPILNFNEDELTVPDEDEL